MFLLHAQRLTSVTHGDTAASWATCASWASRALATTSFAHAWSSLAHAWASLAAHLRTSFAAHGRTNFSSRTSSTLASGADASRTPWSSGLAWNNLLRSTDCGRLCGRKRWCVAGSHGRTANVGRPQVVLHLTV